MTTKEMAARLLDQNSAERNEAETMMGVKFEDMTKEQRLLAAMVLAALKA